MVLVASLALAIGWLVTVAAPRASAVTCAVAAPDVQITLAAGDQIRIRRQGPLIVVSDERAANINPCVSSIALSSTRSVIVTGPATSSDERVSIDLTDGQFAPTGNPKIPGDNEVHFEFNLGPSDDPVTDGDIVQIVGTAGNDSIFLGSGPGVDVAMQNATLNQADLNGDHDSDAVDISAQTTRELDTWRVYGMEGNDIIDGDGDAANANMTGKLLPGAAGAAGGETFFRVLGGPGDDTLTGTGDVASGTARSRLEYIAPAGYTGFVPATGSTTGVTVDLAIEAPTAQNTGEGNDRIKGFNQITASDLSDILRGDAAGNRLRGGNGDDILSGRNGDDNIGGEGGIDTMDFSVTPATSGITFDLNRTDGACVGTNPVTTQITGEGAADIHCTIENVTGSNEADVLTGDTAANVLTGRGGGDVLEGQAGDDRFVPGTGDDFVTGDLGDSPSGQPMSDVGVDTVDYSTSNSTTIAAITLDLAAATSGFEGTSTSTSEGTDRLDEVENVIGTAGNDSIKGDADRNVIRARAGDDVIDGKDGEDTADYSDFLSTETTPTDGVTVNLNVATAQDTGHGTDTITNTENVLGSGHHDTLGGTSVNNKLIGGAGDDVLAGGAGNDELTGAAGSDTADFSTATVAITANLGVQPAPQNTGDGADTLSGIENLYGGTVADTLTGDGQANTIRGNGGNDTMDGAGQPASGGDTLDYTNAPSAVVVNLGGAAPQATGGDGNDTATNFEHVTGSAFNDTLAGAAGDNTIKGLAGNDSLTGRAGNDGLDGGDGSDTADYSAATTAVTADLTAGTGQSNSDGNDTLTGIENVTGSPQADTLEGEGGANTLAGGNGDDIINGKDGNDTENGGDGNDTFNQDVASNGGDLMDGGNGTDTVRYDGRSNPTTVIKDGLANDGEAGEGDNVLASVENVIGANVQTTTTTVPGGGGGAQGQGYWFAGSDGGIFAFNREFFGSTGNIPLAQPIVGMASTPTDKGYWLVAKDGGIFAFGDAGFFGSTGAIKLNQPIVGMASTPLGKGYWLVASDGGIFAFGEARFFGSTGNIKLNQPIVGMASTPSGNGYWFVAADGGIFSFGDAGFFGSTGNIKLNQPIVGMASTKSGKGYWFVAKDGGIFSFGDARFFGSTGNIKLVQPIVGMSATPSGNGYWFVAADGGIFSFGDAAFLGSTGNLKLTKPIIGMAS